MEYYGQTKTAYKLSDTPFKKGGEGSVYDIVGNADYVAKIYHSSVVTAELEAKIKYITNNPPSKSILNQIAWPVDYLTDTNGKFVGFVMPKLKIDAELGDLYVYPPKPKKATLSYEQKIIVAINICRVISEIHKAGYVFGDFNPCNIGVNLTSGNVAFLDTDSYHIYDKDTKHTYRCVVCLNGYVAPELIQNCKGADYKTAPLPTFTQETDRFALAIHIFKLLFNGYTPYNGINDTERSSQSSPGQGNVAIERDNYCFKPGKKPLSPAVPSLDAFPEDICDLFTRAFIGGRYNPAERPTAEEWDKALCSYRSSLVQCKNNPMHHYDGALSSCPYCEADRQYIIAMNGGSTNSSNNSQISFSQPVTVPPVSSGSTPRTSSSGRTSVTGSSSGGSAALGGAINRGTRNQNKVGFKKKLKISLILTLCLILVVGGILGGVYYKNAIDAVNETIELIDYLPDTINEYSYFEDLIVQSYESYSALADWQKEKVTNRDKLLSILTPYNEYKIQNLRTTAEAISVDTVGTTTVLADTVGMYQKLTIEQKQLLTTEEISKFESYVKVQETITLINQINDDLVNKHSQINEARKLYYSIGQEYASLVYNFSLLDTFADKLAFYDLFVFEQLEGGTYSIKVKDPESLTGSVELPARYNGQDVIHIPDGAFKDCKKITSLVVPDTVTQIGLGAFEGCKSLESITLPFTGKRENAEAYEAVLGYIFGYSESIDWNTDYRERSASNTFINRKIGTVDGAIWQYTAHNHLGNVYYYPKSYFYYIPATLTTVTITKQTEIKTAAFNGCENIETINYTSGLTAINSAAFQDCKNLISYNSSIEGRADLSGEYSSIGSYALYNCTKIDDIIIPYGVYTINSYAFANTAIARAVVPDTVESIYAGVFWGCNNLQEITLPIIGKNSGASAYEAVFGYIFGYEDGDTNGGRYGYGIPEEYVVDWNTDYRERSPSNAFINRQIGTLSGMVWQYTAHNHLGNTYYYPQSYYYYIPESLRKVTITKQTMVPIAAFNGCTSLTEITFSNGINTQGDYAFQNCAATIHDPTK